MNASSRERIAAFHAAYIRCIGADHLEAWPAFFAERCHYVVTTADNRREGLAAGLIWADSRAMLQDRISALRHANVYERHRYRHIVGQPFVVGDTPEGTHAETPFMVARIMQDGTTDLFCTGLYDDRFDLSGEQPLLLSRQVICDSSRIDTLLAIPL